MRYVLTAPVNVGDLSHPVLVDALELASIAINFEPAYSDQGKAILSVVLVHRATDYKINIVYRDESGLAFWENMDTPQGQVTQSVFQKLTADGKLPEGTLSAV